MEGCHVLHYSCSLLKQERSETQHNPDTLAFSLGGQEIRVTGEWQPLDFSVRVHMTLQELISKNTLGFAIY